VGVVAEAEHDFQAVVEGNPGDESDVEAGVGAASGSEAERRKAAACTCPPEVPALLVNNAA
jgi:hypothetical protein